MVFFVTKNTFLVGCFEGDQIATNQLTRYANMKRVKKLFLIIKLSNSFFLYSNYGLKPIQIDMVMVWYRVVNGPTSIGQNPARTRKHKPEPEN